MFPVQSPLRVDGRQPPPPPSDLGRGTTVYLDADGLIRSWSADEGTLFVVPREDFGEPVARLFLGSELVGGPSSRLLEGALQHGFGHEYRVWAREDGSTFYARVTLVPLVNARGTLDGYVLTVRRVTLGGDELSLALPLRPDPDEYSALAEHELKTPLTALGLQLELLNRSLAHLPAEGVAGGALVAVRTCRAQVTRIQRLLGGLRAMGISRGGALPLELQEVDLVGVAKEAIELFTHGSEVPPRVLFRGPLSVVGRWDPIRIGQVITNLLSNADKFGSGRPIEVAVTRDLFSTQALITVADRGRGVRAKFQERIFDPFERGDESSASPGLGLGLYICRRIVEAHGGRISLRSELGLGATVTVALPINGAMAR